jgi:energy-coupling factor transporter ATP-binding protein EcfA2
MTASLIILTILGGALIAAAAFVKTRLASQPQADLVALELRFPSALEATAVQAVLTSLTGLLPSWWKRWLQTPTITSEVVADREGVRHLVVLPRQWLPMVDGALRAHLPAARFTEVDVPTHAVDLGTEYRLTNQDRPLAIAADELSRGLLASLQPLQDREQIVVSWTIAAHPPVAPAGTPSRTISALLGRTPPVPHAEQTAALRKKQARPLLLAVGRVGISASSQGRRRALLRHVESSWHGSRAPGVQLHRRHLPSRYVARRIAQRVSPVGGWPAVLNVDELTGLLGWPIGADHLPGIAIATSRLLSLPRAIGTSGTIIGDGWSDGRTRVAALDLDARYHHVALIGPTGTGKSTLLKHLIIQDIKYGFGVLVIDPKSDLVADVLAHIPASRRDDVAVLDAADALWPIGVNPLRLAGVSPELGVEHLVGILRRIFAASWGVRSDDYWRAALRSLIHDPDATLADVGALLTDAVFRRRITDQLSDPVLISVWRSFEALSEAEAAQHVAPVLNKWRQIMSRPSLRRIFGQANPSFDLARSLNSGGIVLVPLSSGTIGQEAGGLFGAVLLSAAWNVIQGRAALAPDQRRPLMIHLDEFASYAALPVPLEELLSQARGFRTGVSLALQHLEQLPVDLRQTVLANPRSRVSFQVGAADARLLAREFGAPVTAQDLQGLAAFEVIAQLHAQGRTQMAATLTTRPAPEPISDAIELREASRRRWGADGEAIDAALVDRLRGGRPPGPPAGDGPTGRKRRSS